MSKWAWVNGSHYGYSRTLRDAKAASRASGGGGGVISKGARVDFARGVPYLQVTLQPRRVK